MALRTGVGLRRLPTKTLPTPDIHVRVGGWWVNPWWGGGVSSRGVVFFFFIQNCMVYGSDVSNVNWSKRYTFKFINYITIKRLKHIFKTLRPNHFLTIESNPRACRGGSRIFERGGGSRLGLQAKKGGPDGGPILGPMLKSLHRGTKGGGGVQTPCPPPPHTHTRIRPWPLV